jgi:hypothetical protein
LSCWRLGTLRDSLLVAVADAQTANPVGGSAAGSGSGQGALLFFVLLAALFVIVAVVVKLLDRSRKRRDEAVLLQARIADAMLLDPSLVKLPVTATVHAPFSRSAPLAVEMSGQVPTTALRDAALETALREASESGLAFKLEDRIEVAPEAGAISRAA